MIITISGEIGAGKSTIGKELARKLNYNYISTGEIFKKLAEERKMGLTEFLKYAEKNLDVDKKIDEKQKEPKQNCVLDSRLGFYFAKPNLKIWLKAPLDIRIKRNAKRYNLKEAKKEIKYREKTEKERYKRLYSVEIFNLENYDLIIDTEKFNIEQIVKMICVLVELVDREKN